MAQTVTAVILAGGSSRRMGGTPKGLLPLAGQPILAHVVARLTPQCPKIYLNTNDDESYRPFALPVIADLRPDRPGPFAGVEAALATLDETWLLTVPVDVPFLPAHLLATLLSHARHTPVTVSSQGRLHPVICLWPRTVLPEIRKALDHGPPKLVQWFAEHPHQVVPFPDTGAGVDPFFNVNHPSALDEAERHWRTMVF